MKYLLVLLVLAVAYGLWRSKTRRPPPSAANRATQAPRTPTAVQAMVECAHCGLHLPQSDALAQGRLHYCCSAHQSAGPR